MSARKKTSVLLLIEEFEAMRETASPSSVYLLNALIRKMEEYLPMNAEEIIEAFEVGWKICAPSPPPYPDKSRRANCEYYFKFYYDNTRRNVKVDDEGTKETE